MDNLTSVEIKAFVPAKDYELSKRFYQDLDFTLKSDTDGLAYFYHNECSFLLQDHYTKEYADNFMMHLLVKNVDAWWEHIINTNIFEKYGVKASSPEVQPWKMKDFTLHDPSGVCWHFGENI
ncbi:MAG: glyoxalase [Methylococcales bacterium]|nr:glyoxalase [Methylococcales bacterium]